MTAPMIAITRSALDLTLNNYLPSLHASDVALYNVVIRIVDAENPGQSALALLTTALENNARPWPAVVGQIVRVLMMHQAHLDYEAGKSMERQNAAMLLGQEAVKFDRGEREAVGQDARERCAAKASVLRTMAAYIARGDRADV